jgi:glycosyltransferase involved in cell wall biosynthesis
MTVGRMLRIGMVVYGDISHDSRVQREANSLAGAGHHVTLFVLAGSREQIPTLDRRIEVIVRGPTKGAILPGSPSPFRSSWRGSRLSRTIDRVRWVVGYARNLRAWGRSLTAGQPGMDVWHAHDFAGLVAISGSIGKGPAIVYDVHDLFVETGTGSRLPGLLRKAIRRYERRLIRGVDLVVAVNRPLAEIVRERSAPRSMIVVHNCPPRWTPPQRRPDLIRAAAGIPAAAPVVLYHGLLSANRGLDGLTAAILEPGLEHVHLAVLGYGPLAGSLSALATDTRYGGRVHVLEAVPPDELLPWVASADVGSLAMPRASLNLFISTPNKLFECLAAGTPVVVSDFPAVREIVIGDPLGPLGATCDPASASDVARAIRGLLALSEDARDDLRARCLEAARLRWNWETEVRRLIAAYAELAASSGIAGGPPDVSS